MKFLVLAAVLAVAVAFPEGERTKRGILGAAPGVVVSGGTSVIHGPSGVITADTGSIAAAPVHGYAAPAVVAAAAPAVVAAPYAGFGYGGFPAYGYGKGAVIVGPSAAGHPGYIKAGGHLFY